MPDLSPAQRRQLDALRTAYEAELPEKITAITQAAAALAARPGEAAQLQDLHRLVHRLAGSSAIWGFTELSRKAGELEGVVVSWLEHAGARDASLDGQVRRLVEALGQSMPAPRRTAQRRRRRDRGD